jgi:Domain of unknown function (DUF4292)
MQKYFKIMLCCASLWACQPVKKVQKIETAILKKDTTKVVLVKESLPIDSVAINKNYVNSILNKKIDFTTFNAKIKVQYYGQEESQNITAYLSIKKDSIIIIQLKGFMGIVGLQAKITKDSVVIVKKVEDKYVQYRSIAYLQDVTQIPFNFSTLQDLLIGNPVFLANNIVAFKSNESQISALMIGDIFKHLVTIDKQSNTIIHSKLDDVDANRNRTCDVTFNSYVPVNDFLFSTFRNISVAEKSKLEVVLDFKEYNFNEMLKYNFNIPKNYKVK